VPSVADGSLVGYVAGLMWALASWLAPYRLWLAALLRGCGMGAGPLTGRPSPSHYSGAELARIQGHCNFPLCPPSPYGDAFGLKRPRRLMGFVIALVRGGLVPCVQCDLCSVARSSGSIVLPRTLRKRIWFP
jgi:hypothetical protein